jgi:hypothetical protein
MRFPDDFDISTFDPVRHGPSLVKAAGDKHGPGFELDNVDIENRVATLVRQSAVAEVSGRQDGNTSFKVSLPRDTKPADGPKIASRLEDQYPGFVMTHFDPYLGAAVMSQLNTDTIRCRSAAAQALSCKPWEVQVTQRQDGGFDFELPATYVPSRHDDRLTEVASAVVGQFGWYWTADAKNLRGSIIPSEPPTFPEVLPFPIEELRRSDWHFTPFGRVLPDPGENYGREIGIDWTASAYGMVAGTPGAGKSVTLNDIIASQLANGVELAIIDVKAKSVDFTWCKNYLRQGGWGCDSLAQAVTVLAMIYEEGERRGRMLAEFDEVNWLNLPPSQQFTPILVIVDEVTALLTTEKAPSGIPKDHPLVVEAVQHNLLVATLQKHISKITAEMRFVGIRMILSTQVTNNNTGIGPALKTKLGHKILAGPNPSEVARKQAFNDPSIVPTVPDNVRAGGARAKGVGAAEMEGAPPAVYKSYFATPADFARALDGLGVRRNPVPEPTPEQIARYTPSIEDSTEDAGPQSTQGESLGGGHRTEAVYGEDGQQLSGIAAANRASTLIAQGN